MANKTNMKDIYSDIASTILKAKIRRANWLQRIVLKGIAKDENISDHPFNDLALNKNIKIKK